MPEGKSLGKGLVERIGTDKGNFEQKSEKGEIRLEQPIADHAAAMDLVKNGLVDPAKGIITSLSDIKGVGHRVLHGGEKFSEPVVINDEVIAVIEDCIKLAPLHNPANLMGIRESIRLFPKAQQVAVFDTAFHQTMPRASYLYALPYELYEKHHIRRYGAHGTSHRFVYFEAVRYLKRSPENTNIITIHLGNGCSMAAVKEGKCLDTSMGLSPLEGLVMGTRSGDIDPQIIFCLISLGYKPADIDVMLNKKSGLLGMTGLSNDMRDVYKASTEGNQKAIDALDVFAHRIRHYIGAYLLELGRVDAIVFTGGIGQWAWHARERILKGLEGAGICLDYDVNKKNMSQLGTISQPYSQIPILVVPTNEELQIAKDSYEFFRGSKN